MTKRIYAALLALLMLPLVASAQQWQTVETTNFVVYYKYDDSKYMKDAGNLAEKYLANCLKKWKLKEPNWRRKCSLYLQDDQAAMRMYGTPGEAPGFTQYNYEFSGSMPVIHVRCDYKDVWTCVLPHEVTHAVMCSLHPSMPRWLDEGMAGQLETPERIKYYQGVVRNAKTYWSAKSIMNMATYPSKDLQLFYCESISLVKYMVDLEGEKTFQQFVKDVRSYGTEKALARNYDLTYESLEKGWFKSLKEDDE